MPSPFATLTPQGATKLLKAAIKAADQTISDAPAVNRKYYDGDHYQDGKEWGGPMPTGNAADVQLAKAEIKRAFTSKNAIKETCGRHMRAVIGGEPQWSVTLRRELGEGEEPTPEEQALIDEAGGALIELWDGTEHKKGLLQALQDATTSLLLSGRSCLRAYVPRGRTTIGADGVRRLDSAPQTLADALDYLYVQHPGFAQAAIARDDDTQQPIALYGWTDAAGKEVLEVAYIDGEQTLLGQFASDGTLQSYPLTLGKRLPIYQMEGAPLITEQVRSQQRLLNMALTMLGRNVILGGFLERIFLNAQMPGKTVTDEEGNKRFVPEPLDVGPGSVNVLRGVKYETDEGKTAYTTPSVVYRDPVSVETFTATKRESYQGILEETHQLHALISGDAAASGESRIQARQDFVSSLGDTVTQVNAAGRWLLEIALAYAAFFLGEPGRYEQLRVTFECRVDTGPISSEDRQAIINEVDADLESREGAMVRLGRTDPDTTLQQIASERERLQTPVEAAQTARAQFGLQQDQQAATGVQDRLRRALEGDAGQRVDTSGSGVTNEA